MWPQTTLACHSSLFRAWFNVFLLCRNSLGMNIMEKRKTRSLTLMMSLMKLRVSSMTFHKSQFSVWSESPGTSIFFFLLYFRCCFQWKKYYLNIIIACSSTNLNKCNFDSLKKKKKSLWRLKMCIGRKARDKFWIVIGPNWQDWNEFLDKLK